MKSPGMSLRKAQSRGVWNRATRRAGGGKAPSRSVRPLLFAAVLAVFVLVGHHEVVGDLARLLALDHALEQPFTVGLRRLDLDVRDLRREHEQLADEVLGARQL